MGSTSFKKKAQSLLYLIDDQTCIILMKRDGVTCSEVMNLMWRTKPHRACSSTARGKNGERSEGGLNYYEPIESYRKDREI